MAIHPAPHSVSPAAPDVPRASTIDLSPTVYGVPRPLAWTLVIFPILGAVILAAMLAWPPTHARGVRVLSEDKLVENFTAIADFLGAILGGAMTLRLLRRRAPWRTVALFGLLSALSFGIGGEEISWGQRLFHVHLLSFMRSNVQSENTLHNLPWLHDINDWLPLGLGLIGLVAILRHTRRAHERSGIPGLLLSHLLVITVLCAYDNFTDWVPIDLKVDTIVGQLHEYAEMLVGFCFAIGMALVIRRDLRAPRSGPASRS